MHSVGPGSKSSTEKCMCAKSHACVHEVILHPACAGSHTQKKMPVCVYLVGRVCVCVHEKTEFACAGLCGCARASAESRLSVQQHMEKKHVGMPVHVLIGSERVFASIPSHAHNRHVSRVRVRAAVSQALISLCLRAISPELAALKHQRETSAVRIYGLVCKRVCARRYA